MTYSSPVFNSSNLSCHSTNDVNIEKQNNNNTNSFNQVDFQNRNSNKSIIPLQYENVSMFEQFLDQFDPFLFIFVMGTGISSDILYTFPYPAHWLRICSYIMFAVASLLFISLQIMFFLHLIYFSKKYSKIQYFNKYFRNSPKNMLWGTYPIGLITIINYLNDLANYFHVNGHFIVSRNLMRLVYILWWYDITVSIFIAWGVTFIIWQDYYFQDNLGKWYYKFEKVAAEHLTSVLLLTIIPMVVGTASSSIFTMSELFTITFNRNIQLLTMVITALIWLHAIIFVFIIFSLYFWSLYVFKIPPVSQVFNMFLVLGPMGQGSLGILLLTDNIKLYVDKYYRPLTDNMEYNILLITIPWCFKIMGVIISMGLLSIGYFFTIISLMAVILYLKRTDFKNRQQQQQHASSSNYFCHFQQGFWGATFPMGTISLGSYELWVQYNKYVPLGAFRVVSTIYAVVCILWTVYCLINTVILYSKQSYRAYKTRNHLLPVKNDETALESIVSKLNP